ncbi:hypothetical protein O7626_03010 [Micromonospora sp. WMMD1102]|uniref:hypothetical protein n=1 Tax=Micromonospora sp. WMMD1102 TaxID=3016105 RepID=UPI00241546D0|nr:hypothetical protein [Micromonospora sp. WMMD1102]MDG4784910.1 hypothetical protein [Micromonospora sp. WMMD1102]
MKRIDVVLPEAAEALGDVAAGTVTLTRDRSRPAEVSGSGNGCLAGEAGARRDVNAGGCVELRVISGRPCTNRRGAAEYLDRSLHTINLVASPKQRPTTGWREPVDVVDGQEWYALDDLDAFNIAYFQAKRTARMARVHQVSLEGDPDELITAKEFRTLIRVSHGAWSKYVEKSAPAWEEGRDGYLIKPDLEEPGRRGIIRSWKRHRVESWINNRTGSASSTGRPKQDAQPGAGG